MPTINEKRLFFFSSSVSGFFISLIFNPPNLILAGFSSLQVIWKVREVGTTHTSDREGRSRQPAYRADAIAGSMFAIASRLSTGLASREIMRT
jgi:hypothetical protein